MIIDINGLDYERLNEEIEDFKYDRHCDNPILIMGFDTAIQMYNDRVNNNKIQTNLSRHLGTILNC